MHVAGRGLSEAGVMRLFHLHTGVRVAELLPEQFMGYLILFGALLLIFRQYGRPFWRSLGWNRMRIPFSWIVICGVARGGRGCRSGFADPHADAEQSHDGADAGPRCRHLDGDLRDHHGARCARSWPSADSCSLCWCAAWERYREFSARRFPSGCCTIRNTETPGGTRC